jgi:lysophospholipase L1-like esterase
MNSRSFAIGVAVLAAVLGSTPLTAGATATASPGHYYLSLGDSLAFGYQEARIQSEVQRGAYSPANFPGYTYRLGSALQELNPSLQVVDYGCPGETTVSFTTGCAFQDGLGLALHDGYPGESQQSAAVSFLAAHPDEVSPITVSLGVNDVTPALTACAPAFSATCVGPYITTSATHLAVILGTLRYYAPHAEIVVLKYYDPYFVTALGAEADTLAQTFDHYIGLAAASASADTADAFAAINEPRAPFTETWSVCKFTLMCTAATDIHLSNPGYSLVARLFYRAGGF